MLPDLSDRGTVKLQHTDRYLGVCVWDLDFAVESLSKYLSVASTLANHSKYLKKKNPKTLKVDSSIIGKVLSPY